MIEPSESRQFGLTKNKSYYEHLIGKPLILYSGNISRGGIVLKVENDFIFLSPYVGNDYRSGRPVMAIREGLASRTRLDTINCTEEVTMEDLRGYCEATNRDHSEKEAEKVSKKNKLD
jgi:hypothetical protein